MRKYRDVTLWADQQAEWLAGPASDLQRSDLEMSAACNDDESSQHNKKHNRGGRRPPLFSGRQGVGPPAVVTPGETPPCAAARINFLPLWLNRNRNAGILSAC